jgi:hypothetical protein
LNVRAVCPFEISQCLLKSDDRCLHVSLVEAEIPEDYDPLVRMLAREVGTSMESPEQFIKYVPWTPAEKRAALRAFDDALERRFSAIITETKRKMANVVDPSDLWELETYLTESGKTIDRIYQYRYSDLLRVFSILMRDGWLKEADLVGLQPDKIAEVKRQRGGLTHDL